MMKSTLTAAAAVSLCAGMAVSAWGQNEQPGDRPATPVRQVRAMPRDPDYRSCHWISDREVVGSDNKKIAEVEDLLVDRGSGRVEYAIITTGAVLGLGGRTVAVPFRAMTWDATGEKFMYSATADELKKLPKWTEKDWSGLVSSARPADDAGRPDMDRNADGVAFRDYYYDCEKDRARYWDPYGSTLDTGQSAEVRGTVKSVERIRTASAGEQTVVTIEDSSGKSHRVALGPSWYVSGAKLAPRRGDDITVRTYAVRNSTDGMSVASTYRLKDQDVRLRENADPMWSGRSYESDGRWYSQPYYRHVLMSQLRGAKLDCRDAACGSVDDVIVDASGGRIEFLSIDPDKNFLGIADSKYLVPWSVVTVGMDNMVRIDTSKEMMLAGQKTPSDLRELRQSGYTDPIYKAYQVSPPAPWIEPDRATGTGMAPDQKR
jgi:sporulation protein YlmC with PRC-barrel domain